MTAQNPAWSGDIKVANLANLLHLLEEICGSLEQLVLHH
jgi:hypothetical protein